ncbi:MAG: hypothetical protein LBJ57_04595 [Prevotellaceae bacterium]|jgi:hypothetical protein|nr:hypothetical protein [Prevotellaceae bacterium]
MKTTAKAKASMRKSMITAGSLLFLGAALLCTRCSNDDDDNGETPPVDEILDHLGDGSTAFEIKGNNTLKYPGTYSLKGFVYVTSGAKLTVEPGVIIKGDKESKATLIVERGGQLIAAGTKERPIVFTSAQAKGQRSSGDWGGLILLGKAPNNKSEQTIEGGVRSNHGGSDPTDNSGVLSYVRVEFAGIEYETDNEINGITFGSVGSGTQVDHVQVSYSGDDSFEWFGGTVNAKYLIAFRGWDDDFDTDNGFSGNVQFALGLRDPKIGDKSASNGFESDNDADGSTATPKTSAVFANVSLFGPVTDPANYTDESGEKGSPSGGPRFQAALHLRRNTNLSIFNSLIAAYPIGLIIENSDRGDAQAAATNGALNVTNTVIAGVVKPFQDKQYWTDNTVYSPNATDSAFTPGYFRRADGGNRAFAALTDLKLSSNPITNLTTPLAFPQSGSPIASGAAWTHAKVAPSFFEKVSYIGAFAPTETLESSWASGWTNFNPQQTDY